jgi:hypothetical protein
MDRGKTLGADRRWQRVVAVAEECAVAEEWQRGVAVGQQRGPRWLLF